MPSLSRVDGAKFLFLCSFSYYYKSLQMVLSDLTTYYSSFLGLGLFVCYNQGLIQAASMTKSSLWQI